MAKFDSKSFNPQAFGAYVKRIPNVTRNELAKSRAVGSNEQARAALSNQTGSLYSRVPYFGRISGETSQNNNGATDIKSTNTTTYEQGFIVASRMDGWTERSFSKNITAGVDFMDNVAAQIADYKMEVKQGILLAILKGIFAMGTTGTSTAAKAAAEFMSNHVLDVSAEGDGLIVATTLNTAMQKACGDNKATFKLAIMHSVVATNLENLNLLKHLTHTDKDGVTRDLSLGTWNGRLVLIDDAMPVDDEGNYTTYVLGEGSIIVDEIGDSVPYEMSRDPKTNGGQDTLYVRERYICGVDGISFEKPASVTASASNADLENGANWAIINDGTKAIPHKAIAIAKIVSKG
ncbi:MAG: phage coat protein [Oscillospiraceae bacterium]|nr:phage coat protein [Oscillospiraceae bacterium]